MPKKVAVRMNNEAAQVFAETAFHTGKGMERAMAAKDYFLNDEARAFWLDKHTKSIVKALKQAGADWDQDRKVVLPRAEDLGRYAAEYAIADAHGKTPIEVTKQNVVDASIKVNNDKRCRAGRIAPGGGAYCEGAGA